MLNIIYKDGKYAVNARELHTVLEVQTIFPNWVKRFVIDYFTENEDFFPKVEKSNGGRPSVEYLLTLDCAKEVGILQKSEKGKELRRYLIGLDNKVENGELLNATQIVNLVALIPCFAIAEIREEAKKQHFDFHNKKYDWHAYRADLLGYDATDLKNALLEIGETYKSIDKAFMKLDKHLLIKHATFDLLIAMRKSIAYAENVSTIAYKASKEMRIDFDRLDSALFQIPLAVREKYRIATKQLA
jgi:phage anti-repressor protein